MTGRELFNAILHYEDFDRMPVAHWRGWPETTERYLHVCLWGTYMIPFGGAGMSWWWNFLDDRNLYWMFKPLAEFAEGEDRRGRNLEMSSGVVLDAAGRRNSELTVDALQNDVSGYFWIYERRLLRAESDPGDFVPPKREGLQLQLSGLKPGSYRVEFWDTFKGGRISELTVEAKRGALRCGVPAFTSDIAGKVKPADTESGFTAEIAENAEKRQRQ